MSDPILSSVPLLGALCVAAGLVSQAQVEHCLQLQIDTFPGTPIGRIMVLQGYCSEPDLARMVAQQQAFRRAFCAAIEHAPSLTTGAPAATPAHEAMPMALPELATFAAAEIDDSPILSMCR